MAETLLSEAFNPQEQLALFSTREAMRDAGVPNWQMGGGVSSADAIRFIAAEREEALFTLQRITSSLRTARMLAAALFCVLIPLAAYLWATN